MIGLFASTAQGLEELLKSELETLGAQQCQIAAGGVHYQADWQMLYQSLLWSRLASRILLPLTAGKISSDEDLYALARAVPWTEIFAPLASFRVQFNGTNEVIRNSQYGAMRVKDAIVDCFTDQQLARPQVDRENADLVIHLWLHKGTLTVSLDLSGGGLHQRGYRRQAGLAPLKENLALAVVLRSGWRPGLPLVDPMCGSGTLLIEAAMLAADIAPGLSRPQWGFYGWAKHDEALWQTLLQAAKQRARQGLAACALAGKTADTTSDTTSALIAVATDSASDTAAASTADTIADSRLFYGYDQDRRMIDMAQANARRAGVDKLIQFAVQEIATLENPLPSGCAVAEQQIGADEPTEQLLTGNELITENALTKNELTEQLLTEQLLTDNAFIENPLTENKLTANQPAAKRISAAQPAGVIISNPPYGERLSSEAELIALYSQAGRVFKHQFAGWRLSLFSASPALLYCLQLRAERQFKAKNGALDCLQKNYLLSGKTGNKPLAQDYANRLTKNIKKWQKWAQQQGLDCYRLYDADLPDYNLALDRYGDWLVMQEYAAPKTVDPHKARQRLLDAISVTLEVLHLPASRLVLKTRQRQQGHQQYEKLAQQQQFIQVREFHTRLLVNLTDYLDSGLFADHRLVRQKIGQLCQGKDFLNLFAYTGSASVYAGLGGARSTSTVDMSRTYLQWAERNLRLNGLTGRQHQLIQADCMVFLRQCRQQFDVIFVDPPTFSNSKRMSLSFDVQRDHLLLLERILPLLRQRGVIIFSCNKRGFRLDMDGLQRAGLQVQDISQQTLAADFARRQNLHHCWLLSYGVTNAVITDTMSAISANNVSNICKQRIPENNRERR